MSFKLSKLVVAAAVLISVDRADAVNVPCRSTNLSEAQCLLYPRCQWNPISSNCYRELVSKTSKLSKDTGAASAPSMKPTPHPSVSPTPMSGSPTQRPSISLQSGVSQDPTQTPTSELTQPPPTRKPTDSPTLLPSAIHSISPSDSATIRPSPRPTAQTSNYPTNKFSADPTSKLSFHPTSIAPSSSSTNVVMSFILMGDIPYWQSDRYCLNQQLRDLDPASMEHPYQFILHVGDIKSGQTSCTSESYSDVAEIFTHPSNTAHYDPRDVFFLVGDNEWSDCSNLETAFMRWMNSFGNGQKTNGGNIGPNPYGFGTFSDPNLRATLEYDWQDNDGSSTNYPTSASNFAFFHNKALFVGINQVGGSVGDESVRVANNFDWVKTNMVKYAPRGMKTLVVFAHATMTSYRYKHFGKPFEELLEENHPDLLVLYAHGDGHSFYLKNDGNLYDLQVEDGKSADPISVTIIRDHITDVDSFKIDRRGGAYMNGCSGNYDVTWGISLF